MGPQFGETVYISEVNRARKVKSDAQVAMNKNSDPVQKVSLGVVEEDSAPTPIFPSFQNCPKRVEKLIFGLQVNIDKANSRRYHVTR